MAFATGYSNFRIGICLFKIMLVTSFKHVRFPQAHYKNTNFTNKKYIYFFKLFTV